MTEQHPDLTFVVEYLGRQRPLPPDFDLDFDLIDNRILDSLSFVNFLYEIEERTGAEVDVRTVAPDDFRTVRNILATFFPESLELR